MTDKLPRVSAAEAVRALEKAGFFLARQSGSHRILSLSNNEQRFGVKIILTLPALPPAWMPRLAILWPRPSVGPHTHGRARAGRRAAPRVHIAVQKDKMP